MAAAFAFASASIASAYHTPREPLSCQIGCDGRLQKWCQGSGSQMHCWCVCYPRSSSNTGQGTAPSTRHHPIQNPPASSGARQQCPVRENPRLRRRPLPSSSAAVASFIRQALASTISSHRTTIPDSVLAVLPITVIANDGTNGQRIAAALAHNRVVTGARAVDRMVDNRVVT